MIKIGTSGYSFDDWVGNVYPKDIKKEDMLKYYQDELGFNTVELNYTYYTLPSQKSIAGIMNKAKDGFEFSVKANKEIYLPPEDWTVGVGERQGLVGGGPTPRRKFEFLHFFQHLRPGRII